MNFKLHSNQNGFSLIELMVVISIVGALATIAFSFSRNFILKAKQVEAAGLAKAGSSLANSYLFSENEAYAAAAVVGNYAIQLSIGEYDTESSCNYANPLGFKISGDCRKTSHVYWLYGHGSAKTFRILAVEAGASLDTKRIFKKCYGLDLWVADNSASVSHVMNPINAADCGTCIMDRYSSSLGGSRLDFDLDGNGAVDADDANALWNFYTSGSEWTLTCT